MPTAQRLNGIAIGSMFAILACLTPRNAIFLFVGWFLGITVAVLLIRSNEFIAAFVQGRPLRIEIAPIEFTPIESGEQPDVSDSPEEFEMGKTMDLRAALKSLGRSAGLPVIVSDKVQGSVTLAGSEDRTPRELIEIIVVGEGLVVDDLNGTLLIKTIDERAAEPAIPMQYRFQRARAAEIRPLLQKQLQSGIEPQVDERTNTIFYRETKSNLATIDRFLEYVDQDLSPPKIPDGKFLRPAREFQFQTWGDKLLPWSTNEQLAETTTPYEGKALEVDETTEAFEIGIKFSGFPFGADFVYVQPDGKVTICSRYPGKDQAELEEFTLDEETLRAARVTFQTSKVGHLAAAYYGRTETRLSCELKCSDGSRSRQLQFDDHFPLELRVFVNEVVRVVSEAERPEAATPRTISLTEAIEVERRFFPREPKARR